MRFRKRLIFLIVVAVSAKDVHDFMPGPDIALAGSPPLAKGDSWDALEVGSLPSMFEPDPEQPPFGWSDDFYLLKSFGLPPEKKDPPLTVGLTNRRPAPGREIPAPVEHWWTFNGPAGGGWAGGNGGVQRYVTAGGGPVVPPGTVPGTDLPSGGNGGPIALPPISGFPFRRSGFGGPIGEDPPVIGESPAIGSGPVPVPEPGVLALVATGALVLLWRRSN